MSGDPRGWMWSEALEMLARAERLQRQLFQPGPSRQARPVCWEPPTDLFETPREVVVMIALPGVQPAAVRISIEDGFLDIYAERTLPRELRQAVIHRLELPQGCFQRQVRLPPGAYGEIRRTMENGCLIVTLQKS